MMIDVTTYIYKKSIGYLKPAQRKQPLITNIILHFLTIMYLYKIGLLNQITFMKKVH